MLTLIRIVHMFQNVEGREEHVDDRSVDDLLSFINGNDGGKISIFCPPFHCIYVLLFGL